tara:strand:+ start:166 stop:1446 length:1281 start_codon:yes stop_codon:yes gene_type:complete
MKISNVHARELLDSRGNPTIEVDIILNNQFKGRAIVPSGASTGEYEAVELRDNDPKRFLGKGVLNAVNNVNSILADNLIGNSFSSQSELDYFLIELDGTKNKQQFGANAILGISMAFGRASAKCRNISLFKSFQEPFNYILPTPMMNIINGGSHANNNIDFQEFMIFPVGAKSFSHSLQMGVEVFHHLKTLLNDKGFSTAVGDEGGFAPNLKSNNEAIEVILEAISRTSFTPGKDIYIALDVAASELYINNTYHLESNNSNLSSEQMIDYLSDLVKQYPIISIEDGLDENDWVGWNELNRQLGSKCQIVGDDLTVTNKDRLARSIENKSMNAILIKLNQIGTITETIEAIDLAKKHNFGSIVSHRSGETEDSIISDFSVSMGNGQIKTGSLSRTDRVGKYNQLLRIEEKLGSRAIFAGSKTMGIDL